MVSTSTVPFTVICYCTKLRTVSFVTYIFCLQVGCKLKFSCVDRRDVTDTRQRFN